MSILHDCMGSLKFVINFIERALWAHNATEERMRESKQFEFRSYLLFTQVHDALKKESRYGRFNVTSPTVTIYLPIYLFCNLSLMHIDSYLRSNRL